MLRKATLAGALALGLTLSFGTTVAAQTSKPQFDPLVQRLQSDPSNQALRKQIIQLANSMNPKPAVPEKVNELLGEAQAAIKAAKSQKNERDLGDAVNALKRAALLAPWSATVYYNLGTAQELSGQYDQAVSNFRLYLLAEPNARNATQVEQRIGADEYAAGHPAQPAASASAAAAPAQSQPAPKPKPVDLSAATPLDRAAYMGQLDKVEYFIAQGALPDGTDANGDTPLDYAIRGGRSAVTQYLYGKEFPNKWDKDAMQKQFERAVERGYVLVAEFFLAHGANASGTYRERSDPVEVAVESGNTAMVEMLLAHGASVDVGDEKDDGAKLLGEALEFQHPDVARDLLSRGIDAQKLLLYEIESLHSQAYGPDVALLRFLLANGTDVNRKDAKGLTPLQFEIMYGDSSNDVVELLVKYGADVNVTIPNSKSPLGWALSGGQDTKNLSLAKLFIDHGANVNGVGSDGESLLGLAAKSHSAEVVQDMLAHGADVNAPDNLGNTPLCLAVPDFLGPKPSLPTLKLLLDHGASAPQGCREGETEPESPLSRAVLTSNVEVVRLLLEHGANANTPSYSSGLKNTPLIEDSFDARGNVKIASLLVAHGAEVNATESDGETALCHAAAGGQLPLVQFLVTHGADVNARCLFEKAHYRWGWEERGDALKAAKDHNRPEVVEYLRSVGAH